MNGQEDGAVAVFMAILLVVLVGMAAIVVDIGDVFWERRMLQNGADAAALAVAQDCAQGDDCGDYAATAATFATANNGRGAFVASVVGQNGNSPTPAGGSVTVVTQTGDLDEPGRLRQWFSGVLAEQGMAATATATVSWTQRVGAAATIPIAICNNNWQHHTANGAKLPSGDPAGTPHLIRYSSSQNVANVDAHDQACGNPGGPGNTPYPGGFGFLERRANCTADTNDSGYFDGIAGSNPHDPKSGCTANEMYQFLRERIDAVDENGGPVPVLIPIFKGYRAQGSAGQFEIEGYGAFVLKGYRINAGGPETQAWRQYGMPSGMCTGGNSHCLYGYYTEWVALDGTPSQGGGVDYGTRLISFVE